jgi:L-iditol 2-dehydrogenase
VTGLVESVGSDSDGPWLGARVAIETYFSTCEICAMCRSGRRNLCAMRRSIGSFENGGFASHVVVPVVNLHELPTWLNDVEGALAEPLACVAHCLMSPAIVQAGDRVLVTGPGAMGQLAAQVAAAHGGDVTLVGLPRDAERLAVARSLGIGVSTDPPAEAAFDVVLETSGSEGGARAAMSAAARGARYVQIGIFAGQVSLDFNQVLYKELTVSSGFASTAASWADAMSLIAQKKVTLGPLISSSVPLRRFTEALSAAERGEGLKTIVTPQ